MHSLSPTLANLLAGMGREEQQAYLAMLRSFAEQALAAVNKQENPALWGIMQNDLSGVLLESNEGSRTENLEQAIAHY